MFAFHENVPIEAEGFIKQGVGLIIQLNYIKHVPHLFLRNKWAICFENCAQFHVAIPPRFLHWLTKNRYESFWGTYRERIGFG